MFIERNQIHNFMSSSGSGTIINYGSGSDSNFLTKYGSDSGSGSTSQKVTVPTVPVPVPLVKKLRFLRFRFQFHNAVRCKSFLREICDHRPFRTEDSSHEAKEEHVIMTESPLHVAGEPSLHVCRTCGKGFFSREDSVAHMRLCSRIIKLKEKIKG